MLHYIDPVIFFNNFTEIRLQEHHIDITKIDMPYDRVTRFRYNSIAMYGILNPIECDRFGLNRFRHCRENCVRILVTHIHTDICSVFNSESKGIHEGGSKTAMEFSQNFNLHCLSSVTHESETK